jgi:putative tricarboxylic transport membrane protein
MESLPQLIHGFSIALQPINLIMAFIGVTMGTLVGVLPGLGPAAAMALLLPITYGMTPTAAIIMLAGIYYGAQYGGSTTSILVNIPGEASSVITCLDGYQMARKGRAGPALGIAAIGSFIAGTMGVVGMSFLAIYLVEAALTFGPPEYFSLICAGLTLLMFLGRGSMLKALIMAILGLLVGTVGIDGLDIGTQRFTFNKPELMDGIGLVPIVMGIFGISEILLNIEKSIKVSIYETRLRGILPSLQDLKRCSGSIFRGSLIGFFLGIIPGGGAVIASFTAYAIEKRFSKYPEKFGTGVIEGVAAPESANNAAAQGAFIPLLTLGIPANVVMALLMAALMVHGVSPGPMLMANHPDLFWGVIASMYIGNIMLLILNMPLIPIWVKLLKIPYSIFFPFILLFCLIGVYTVDNSIFDIYMMILFGVFGYIVRKFDFEGAPFILALVLGPMFERALRQSLMISHGSFSIFFSRPLSAALLSVAVFLMGFSLFMSSKRKKIPSAEDDS